MTTSPLRRLAAGFRYPIFRTRRAAAGALLGVVTAAFFAALPAAAQSRPAALPLPSFPARSAPVLTHPAPPFAAPPSGLSVGGETGVDGRIEVLRAQLAITPPQLPLWNALAHAIRESAQSATALSAQRALALPRMSAADNLHDYARIACAYADNLERLAAAFDRLYTQLSPVQRRTADAALRQSTALAATPGR